MVREITFSKTYPFYHPKKGQPTYFVEKIWKGLYDEDNLYAVGHHQEKHDSHFGIEQIINVHQFKPKLHTIRQGNKFKKGDFIRPMVWAGRPYHKTENGLWKIQICDELEIKNVFDFKLMKKQIF